MRSSYQIILNARLNATVLISAGRSLCWRRPVRFSRQLTLQHLLRDFPEAGNSLVAPDVLESLSSCLELVHLPFNCQQLSVQNLLDEKPKEQIICVLGSNAIERSGNFGCCECFVDESPEWSNGRVKTELGHCSGKISSQPARSKRPTHQPHIGPPFTHVHTRGLLELHVNSGTRRVDE